MKSQKVLIFVTAQPHCEAIINEGKKLAEKLCTEFEVVTVQPKRAEAETRSRDMKTLVKLAKNTGTAIKIIYSNQPLNSLVLHADNVKPIHIFTGEQAENSKFVSSLSVFCNAPITMVSKNNKFTLNPALFSPSPLT